MLARNHVVFGIGTWLVVGVPAGLDSSGLANSIALASIGSLLPDVDHPKSWLGRRLPGISHAVALTTGHRGMTHSALLAIVSVFVLAAISLQHWAAPLLVGFMTHIFCDWCTKGGVPLLWPLKTRFRSPVAFSTGGIFEYAVTGMVLVAVGWLYGQQLAESLGV